MGVDNDETISERPILFVLFSRVFLKPKAEYMVNLTNHEKLKQQDRNIRVKGGKTRLVLVWPPFIL